MAVSVENSTSMAGNSVNTSGHINHPRKPRKVVNVSNPLFRDFLKYYKARNKADYLAGKLGYTHPDTIKQSEKVNKAALKLQKRGFAV